MRSRFDVWTRRESYRDLVERAEALLATVGLAARRHEPVESLAHGDQRSLEIAVALACDPRLLLLDEPTAGMSPEEARAMMDLILRLNRERTVILVEHRMKLVMGISDRILVLHHGRLLAEGAPDEIRAHEEVRRVYLGQSV
jgi:branched-chain amino acid transport system ATP-binding protein